MNRNDRQFAAQKIRAQYMEKQITDLDELRQLDKKVKRPAYTFAYIFGSISAIIFGAGMSLVMTEIGEFIGLENTLVTGIVVGIVGMAMAFLTYPIYNGILNSRKKKYASQIIELTDKIINK